MPYVAALGGLEAFAQQRAPEMADFIKDSKEALDVMDFEEAAHRKVLPGTGRIWRAASMTI
jgi:hypothetical protein